MVGVDPKIKAQEYLEKHKLLELFQNLNAAVLYKQPEDPRKFLVDELWAIRKARDAGKPPQGLFTDDDLDAMFGMFDVIGRGSISTAQYAEAMRTIGVSEFDRNPEEAKGGLDMRTFRKLARQNLDVALQTYAPPKAEEPPAPEPAPAQETDTPTVADAEGGAEAAAEGGAAGEEPKKEEGEKDEAAEAESKPEEAKAEAE